MAQSLAVSKSPGVVRPEAVAFAVRTTLATLLALWIGFKLQLGYVYSAPVTIWLVSRPQARATFARSVARFLGTFVGCLGGIILMATVAQAPTTAIVLLSLWMGACGAGAVMAHNAIHGYFFQLAGFTILSIVAITFAQPESTVLVSVEQLAIVTAGIFSLFVVDTLLPFGLEAPADAPPAGTPHTRANVIRSGVICGVATLASGMFWLATAWPHGQYFLFSAALVTCFFGPLLEPDLHALEFSVAMFFSGFLAALYAFLFLNPFSDFIELALLLTPVLLAGGLAVAHPKLAANGAVIFMAYLFILLQPANATRPDPVNLINLTVAYGMGGLLGLTIFELAGRDTLL